MPTFAGSITTTGKSEAIRLDKALFRLHPEFRQKAKVRVSIIAPGHALISVVDHADELSHEEDPIVGAYLGFLAKDMQSHPGRETRLTKATLRRAVRLTKGVKVSDRDTIPTSITL
jgi:antitoxin PrlF